MGYAVLEMPAAEIVLYFGVYSFLGWLIESSYRTAKRGRLVNSGFLYGPFIPVFGFGGLIIHLLYLPLGAVPYAVALVVMTLAVTLLELITGLLMHRVFGLMLWDYSEHRYNLGGYICPRFSLYWLGLAVVVTRVLRPVLLELSALLSPRASNALATVFVLYLALDAAGSSSALWRFASRLRTLAEEAEAGVEAVGSRAGAELERFAEQVRNTVRTRTRYILHPISKISSVLPEHLTALLSRHYELHEIVERAIERVRRPVSEETRRERELEEFAEVRELFHELAESEAYRRLSEIPFGDTTLYTHNERVARVAFRLAKRLGLDAVAVFRGALLRLPTVEVDRRARENWSSFTRTYFPEMWEHWERRRPFRVVEQDVILYSTWPHSPHPPRTVEGALVAAVALTVAVRERGRSRSMPKALQRARVFRRSARRSR